MALEISPSGLGAAAVPNQLNLLFKFRESLCQPFCIDSSVQPFAQVEYSLGVPRLEGSTVFIPVTARISILVPGECPCESHSNVYTEQFYVNFVDQTSTGTATIESLGRIQNGSDVECGLAYAYSINDSVRITFTPAAATPAA